MSLLRLTANQEKPSDVNINLRFSRCRNAAENPTIIKSRGWTTII